MGLDKIPSASLVYKRRYTQPVKSKFRHSMMGNEPADKFEYISRHFKIYDFTDMTNIEECEWTGPNFTLPLYESVGGLVDGTQLLCGGMTRNRRKISKCYAYKNDEWVELVDLKTLLISHSATSLNDLLYLQNQDQFMSISASGQVTNLTQLPFVLTHACILPLDTSNIAIIGTKFLERLNRKW